MAEHDSRPETPAEVKELREMRREADAEAAKLLGNCAIDPIASQSSTMREHMAEFVKESSVGSEHGIDWTKAHWQHPLLQQLGDLSILSSFDMPFRQHLIERLQTQLPVSHPAAERLHEISPSAVLVKYNPHMLLEDHEAREVLPTEFDRRFFANTKTNTHVAPPGSTQVNTSTWTSDPPPIEHRPTSEAAAVPSCVLDMKHLVHLSPETVEGDPNLKHLVALLTEKHKSDPAVAERLTMSKSELPVLDASSRGIPAPTDGPRPPVHSPNKAFHESDIVAYPSISKGLDSSETKRSMHDVGYLTWAQKAIDVGARAEDEEAYYAFRESFTTAQGQAYAVEDRLSAKTVPAVTDRQ